MLNIGNTHACWPLGILLFICDSSHCFDLQIPSLVKATIGLEWNVSTLGKPIPALHTTQVTDGTVLVDALNKATDEGAGSSFNRYWSPYCPGARSRLRQWTDFPLVCIWFFGSLCTGLRIGLRPVLTNGACAKLIISFLLIGSRERHVWDDLQ